MKLMPWPLPQTLTKTLEDIHHALGSYSKALDRLGPSLTPALLKLPSSDIEKSVLHLTSSTVASS